MPTIAAQTPSQSTPGPSASRLDPRELLKELLLRGLVSADEVQRITAKPEHYGKPVERALVDEGAVAESVVLSLSAELSGIALITLTPENIDLKLGSQLPLSMLKTYCVYPLRREPDSELQPLAVNDPYDVLSEDAIRLLTGREVTFALAPRAQIESAINGTLMSSEGFRILVDQLPEGKDALASLSSLIEAEKGELTERAGPIIKLVDSILFDAISKKASDIHIESRELSFRVRYRIDGIMSTVAELPKKAERTCISRIKIISGMDIAESRRTQDGRLSLRGPHGKVHMRVSTVPSQHGETVVMRILDQSAVALEMEQLGLDPAGLAVLRGHLASSTGMVLVTGPTGSGKTTTLYAALRLLNQPGVNILTIEDPVEFQLDGITQVQVANKTGVTFGSALRSFLRQDPDIIMVGEIRDLETAEISIQAAQTGHLVLSTLHTTDAPTTLSRMVLMGVEPHLLADSLLMVIAQRLVRRLCPACRAPVTVRPEHSSLLDLSEEELFPRKTFGPVGCAECGGSGYRGRLGLYELLTVTSSIRQQMLVDPSEIALWRLARSEGMVTLLNDGINKVNAGLTSLDEVLRTVTVRRKPGRKLDIGALSLLAGGPEVGASGRSVAEVMSSRVIALRPETLLRDAARLFLQEHISGAPVVTGTGELVGVVSYRDLATSQLLSSGPPVKTVENVMSGRPITIGPKDSVEVADQMLRRHRIHRLIVWDGAKLLGVVTPSDLTQKPRGPKSGDRSHA